MESPRALADHQRSLLQAEESRLLALLSSVRTTLNTLLPISTLPSEVLESIFGICVSWLYGHHQPKYRLAWTQVCRTWREISLNSARLWQYIDVCDSRLAHEFLIRSGTAPISVISASPLKLCTDNLQPHAARLQSIDVFLFPDDMKDLFASIGSDLSNLTSLSLKIPPVSGNFCLRILTQVPHPQLTRLALDGVSIPWGMCRNLTYLCLRGLSAEHCPSVFDVHTILASSPRIEYLRLENLNPSSLESDLPLVHLPALQTLTFSNKAFVTYTLLSIVTFPQTTRVQISCPLFTSLPKILPLPFPRQSPASKASCFSDVPEVPTIRLGRNTLHLIHDAHHEPQPWTECFTSFYLTLTLSSPAVTSKSPSNAASASKLLPVRVLPHLHRLLPTLSTSLTSLELSMGVLSGIPPGLLADFLSHTPNLERIMIAFNEKLDDLLLALSPNNSSDANVLCPRLRTLAFGTPVAGYIWHEFHTLWFTLVVQVAAARHVAGIPLALMEFRACQGLGDAMVRQAFEMGEGKQNWLGEVRVMESEMPHRESPRSPPSCVRRDRFF